MKVFARSKFSVYIHAVDHPPPHCHVRYVDGSEVCATIPLAEPMYGATISYDVRDALLNEMEILTITWDTLHPKRN